jgi:hypothetical protein
MISNIKEETMELRDDLNVKILEVARRALTARDVMDFMRDKDQQRGYNDWAVKWMLYTDILALLTGRPENDCMTRRDFEDIIKEYGVQPNGEKDV